MRPRRSGGGSRPFDWYIRSVVVAVPAWLASSSMVSWPSSLMRLIVLLQSDYIESIYSHNKHSHQVSEEVRICHAGTASSPAPSDPHDLPFRPRPRHHLG